MPRSLNRTENLNMTKQAKKAERAEKRRIRRSAWVDEDLREIEICKGVTIDRTVYDISENRYWTLLIKGFIVYLITAGGIGCYLSALDIQFSALIFHVVILLTAILCACLYHSRKSENLGYLIFFSVYAGSLFLFRDYINSGFYAIVNDTNEYASIYFKTEGLQHYNERISNRYVAITVAVTLIGIAVNILLNNYILRRARYMIAAGIAVTVNLIPLYMEREPKLIYTLMLIAGLSMTFALKCGRHFTLSRNDHIFKRRKWGLSYGLDYRSLLQGMILVGALVLVMANIVNLVRPRDSYYQYRSTNKYKEATREDIQNLIMLGFAGLWNMYPNNGGLSTGELGGVASIRLDYRPDIEVTFTPYSYGTLYIKNFIGESYEPYENVWHQPATFHQPEEQNYYEAEALKKAYEEGEGTAAKGVMQIKNLAAAQLTYHPYYTEDEWDVLHVGETQTFTYYPLLDTDLLKAEPNASVDSYLAVPEQNLQAVSEFAAAAGLYAGIDPSLAMSRIRAYYESEIPYTIRPGATPRNEDFVNYFLKGNRKGYCAHFASAATLALRSVGIPARYCEGYAISYSRITGEGELVDTGSEDNYDPYYSGYSTLGRTALVRVTARDAEAHAWVEMYVAGSGWVVAEMTPSSTLEEDDGVSSFWESFNDVFGDGDVDNSDGGAGGGGGFNLSISDDALRIAAFVFLGLVLITLSFFAGRKLAPLIRYHIDYRRGGPSEKLILYFSRKIRKKKRDAELKTRVNYREQLECLYDRRRRAGAEDSAILTYREPGRKDGRRVNDPSLEELIRVMEQAGFSNREIREEDFRRAKDRVDELLQKPGSKKRAS